MLDDQPPQKKKRGSSQLVTAAQTTHNVEQDGYGLHIHPTTSVHITARPTTISGKLIRTTRYDLDFPASDEKNRCTYHNVT
jgi:hypothetical protein